MLVDDLIEWRNVVIATSGSSVGWAFTALGGDIESKVWGIPYIRDLGRHIRIYKDNQFIKYI